MGVRDVPGILAAPLAGRDDAAWHAAPGGKWSPAQIVDHVATAIENSAKGFASRLDKGAMTRRPRTAFQRAGWLMIRTTGWFGPPRTAPATTIPAEATTRAAAEARLAAAIEAFTALEPQLATRTDCFLKHPVLGDLTYAEFAEFHVRHAQHHRKQILQRLANTAP